MPLKIVRRPKSPHWIIRGTVRGRRVEESTGVADREIAEEIRARREDELLRESIYGRAATATFAQAVVSYLETGGRHGTGGDGRFLKPILDHFRTALLVQIDLDALDRAAARLYPRASPATRNRQFYTPAVAVLRHAARRGWCAAPIVRRPSQPDGRVRWITPDEAERLIEAAAKHLRPLIVFLLYTGARAGEALWLDWRDVDLARAHVTFPQTKSGHARGVPLHHRVVAALANLPGRVGPVFRKPNGRPYEPPKANADTSAGARIRTAFLGACRRAGIERFTPHDCRHTWATWHYAANRDLGALKRLGGWRSERMVLRYAHVNVDELAHTIGRLPGGKLGEDDSAASENDAGATG